MMNGYKRDTEAQESERLVGEHSVLRRRLAARPAGADGKANVGISNDNAGVKPAHRKTKVSWPTIIGSG